MLYLFFMVFNVHQVQFVVPIYSWICGLLLEYGHFTGYHTLKEDEFSLSSQLSVVNSSRLRVKFCAPLPHRAVILSRLRRHTCALAVIQLWVQIWTCTALAGNFCLFLLIHCHSLSLNSCYCLSFIGIPKFCGLCLI